MSFALLSSTQCKNFHQLTFPDALSRKWQNGPRNNWKRKPNDKRVRVSLISFRLSVFKHGITKYIDTRQTLHINSRTTFALICTVFWYVQRGTNMFNQVKTVKKSIYLCILWLKISLMALHLVHRCVNLRHQWEGSSPLDQNCKRKKTHHVYRHTVYAHNKKACNHLMWHTCMVWCFVTSTVSDWNITWMEDTCTRWSTGVW